MNKKDPVKESLVTNSDYSTGSKINSKYNSVSEASVTISQTQSQAADHSKDKRGLMVFIFCLMNFSVGFLSSPLAPISKATRLVYDQNLAVINLASSIFSFAGLTTGLLANMVIHKIGIRKATLLCAVLYEIGMVAKLFISESFYFVHLGEIIAGLGGPFVQYGIANFADHWFEGKQRGIYISILSTMNPIGTMVAFVYPFIFVNTKGTVT